MINRYRALLSQKYQSNVLYLGITSLVYIANFQNGKEHFNKIVQNIIHPYLGKINYFLKIPQKFSNSDQYVVNVFCVSHSFRLLTKSVSLFTEDSPQVRYYYVLYKGEETEAQNVFMSFDRLYYRQGISSELLEPTQCPVPLTVGHIITSHLT